MTLNSKRIRVVRSAGSLTRILPSGGNEKIEKVKLATDPPRIAAIRPNRMTSDNNDEAHQWGYKPDILVVIQNKG